MKKKIKEIPIYKGKLVVILSGDYEKINETLGYNLFEAKDDIYAHAVSYSYKKHRAYYIILNFENKTKINHGVIAHEALHVVNFITKETNIVYDNNNDEAYCYLLEWVTNEVYSFIKNKIKI